MFVSSIISLFVDVFSYGFFGVNGLFFSVLASVFIILVIVVIMSSIWPCLLNLFLFQMGITLCNLLFHLLLLLLLSVVFVNFVFNLFFDVWLWLNNRAADTVFTCQLGSLILIELDGKLTSFWIEPPLSWRLSLLFADIDHISILRCFLLSPFSFFRTSS
jgi:hypothetical protein